MLAISVNQGDEFAWTLVIATRSYRIRGNEGKLQKSPTERGAGQPRNAGGSSAAQTYLKRAFSMSKPSKHGPNKAKSIIAQPLFRSRQERPAKGKGSYRREAFQSKSWEASYFLAA